MAKKRNPVLVIILTFITLGIYGIYWFYQTSKELIAYTHKQANPLLWTIGLFIPVLNLIVIWKYAHAVEEATGGRRNGILIFLLWMVFFPAVQYVVQSELNKLA